MTSSFPLKRVLPWICVWTFFLNSTAYPLVVSSRDTLRVNVGSNHRIGLVQQVMQIASRMGVDRFVAEKFAYTTNLSPTQSAVPIIQDGISVPQDLTGLPTMSVEDARQQLREHGGIFAWTNGKLVFINMDTEKVDALYAVLRSSKAEPADESIDLAALFDPDLIINTIAMILSRKHNILHVGIAVENTLKKREKISVLDVSTGETTVLSRADALALIAQKKVVAALTSEVIPQELLVIIPKEHIAAFQHRLLGAHDVGRGLKTIYQEIDVAFDFTPVTRSSDWGRESMQNASNHAIAQYLADTYGIENVMYLRAQYISTHFNHADTVTYINFQVENEQEKVTTVDQAAARKIQKQEGVIAGYDSDHNLYIITLPQGESSAFVAMLPERESRSLQAFMNDDSVKMAKNMTLLEFMLQRPEKQPEEAWKDIWYQQHPEEERDIIITASTGIKQPDNEETFTFNSRLSLQENALNCSSEADWLLVPSAQRIPAIMAGDEAWKQAHHSALSLASKGVLHTKPKQVTPEEEEDGKAIASNKRPGWEQEPLSWQSRQHLTLQQHYAVSNILDPSEATVDKYFQTNEEMLVVLDHPINERTQWAARVSKGVVKRGISSGLFILAGDRNGEPVCILTDPFMAVDKHLQGVQNVAFFHATLIDPSRTVADTSFDHRIILPWTEVRALHKAIVTFFEKQDQLTDLDKQGGLGKVAELIALKRENDENRGISLRTDEQYKEMVKNGNVDERIPQIMEWVRDVDEYPANTLVNMFKESGRNGNTEKTIQILMAIWLRGGLVSQVSVNRVMSLPSNSEVKALIEQIYPQYEEYITLLRKFCRIVDEQGEINSTDVTAYKKLKGSLSELLAEWKSMGSKLWLESGAQGSALTDTRGNQFFLHWKNNALNEWLRGSQLEYQVSRLGAKDLDLSDTYTSLNYFDVFVRVGDTGDFVFTKHLHDFLDMKHLFDLVPLEGAEIHIFPGSDGDAASKRLPSQKLEDVHAFYMETNGKVRMVIDQAGLFTIPAVDAYIAGVFDSEAKASNMMSQLDKVEGFLATIGGDFSVVAPAQFVEALTQALPKNGDIIDIEAWRNPYSNEDGAITLRVSQVNNIWYPDVLFSVQGGQPYMEFVRNSTGTLTPATQENRITAVGFEWPDEAKASHMFADMDAVQTEIIDKLGARFADVTPQEFVEKLGALRQIDETKAVTWIEIWTGPFVDPDNPESVRMIVHQGNGVGNWNWVDASMNTGELEITFNKVLYADTQYMNGTQKVNWRIASNQAQRTAAAFEYCQALYSEAGYQVAPAEDEGAIEGVNKDNAAYWETLTGVTDDVEKWAGIFNAFNTEISRSNATLQAAEQAFNALSVVLEPVAITRTARATLAREMKSIQERVGGISMAHLINSAIQNKTDTALAWEDFKRTGNGVNLMSLLAALGDEPVFDLAEKEKNYAMADALSMMAAVYTNAQPLSAHEGFAQEPGGKDGIFPDENVQVFFVSGRNVLTNPGEYKQMVETLREKQRILVVAQTNKERDEINSLIDEMDFREARKKFVITTMEEHGMQYIDFHTIMMRNGMGLAINGKGDVVNMTYMAATEEVLNQHPELRKLL